MYRGYPLFAFYNPGVKILVLLAIIWSIIWKGIALWKAGRNNQLGWFVVLLLINLLGILDIIYIFGFSKKEIKAEIKE